MLIWFQRKCWRKWKYLLWGLEGNIDLRPSTSEINRPLIHRLWKMMEAQSNYHGSPWLQKSKRWEISLGELLCPVNWHHFLYSLDSEPDENLVVSTYTKFIMLRHSKRHAISAYTSVDDRHSWGIYRQCLNEFGCLVNLHYIYLSIAIVELPPTWKTIRVI